MIGIANAISIGMSGAVVSTPRISDYVSASKIAQNVRADLGITLNSTRVSAWADQASGAKHYAQATAGNQPLYSATGGKNGLGHVQLDSVSRFMVSALNLAAPGTQNVLLWTIVAQDSWTTHGRIFTASGNLEMNIQQGNSTPNMRTYNGAFGTVNGAPTLGAWFRVAAFFSNSTSDFLKIGATNVTGYNAGNSASVGRLIGNDVGGSALVSIAEAAVILPTDAADAIAITAALDTYATAWHTL